MRKILVALMLVVLAAPAWGEMRGISTIYKMEKSGTVDFMVKTTNIKNKYFWYVSEMRCIATYRKTVIYVECPNHPTMAVVEDSGDVSIKIDNEVVGTYSDGSVMFGMYKSIANHNK